MTELLNPLTLPLRGSRLIEASAGTGKTWTIAALYLRLVLGHGSLPRLPGEILVMTFTKAATRELSDRIRRRLVEAAAHFRGEANLNDDAFLQELRAGFPDGPERQQAAWRLAMAAEAMDDAAVHTIDAWCQRMLREHAFDSGCLFDEELQAQEAALRAEAARDYWRQQVYPLGDDALPAVLARWKDLAALEKDVRDLIDKTLPAGAGQGSLGDVAARARQRLATLKLGWAERANEMRAWLNAQWQSKTCAIDKKKLGEFHGGKWLQALQDWALDPAADHPKLGVGSERLTRQGVLNSLKPGMTVEAPDVFSAFGDLMAALDGLPPLSSEMRLHAAACVLHRMQQLKTRAGTFGFADMLNRLDRALDPALQGAPAQRLRERILAQYPVALIDEFQDTSPLQLRIFDRLYRIAEDEPSRALLLIGDPKQAIYQFRGADIYSYLWARRATQGRHHVLDTNHRSTQALVGAVNALFLAADRRPGEGAFLFRQPGAASDLPFFEVKAQGRPERLVGAQGALAPLTLVVDETLRNKDDSRSLFAALCAERIVSLLNDPQAGFEEAGRPFRRLQPADMAVLVRSGKEADAVRHEMRRRGLASVYLSDKDTVFQSSEAADLLRLLQAVAAPRDMRLARAALATALLGFTLPELVALASDDAAFDRQCESLQQLNQVWKGQGVLAMVRQALHAFGLPARWLSTQAPTADGERRLTNVLHLAELLQAASAQAEGEQALVRWLLQQRAEAESGLGGGDDLVLRLESDADLVKVVTVHKSKGLEYPLVFLPFPAHFREVLGNGESAKDKVLLLPAAQDAGGERQLVLAPSKEQIALEDKEQQRENLRLLYVALTRARHALWVGLSGLQVGTAHHYLWHRSAIGYLLSGADTKAPEQRLQDIQALAAAAAGVALEHLPVAEGLPLPPATRLQPRGEAPPLASPPAYTASFQRNWSVSSYSALVRDATWGGAGSGALPARVVRDDEPDAADDPAPPPRPAHQPWHRFPRGALAGNFLHDQLEWLAGEHFALDTSAELQQRLLRRCDRQGWGHRGDDVLAWLRRVCSTPLPVLGVPLAGLETRVPEMEFWFPSDGLQARRVDELCRQHLQPGQARPQLPDRSLAGMLMGFADLVFEHAGRFWVLDHKSNSLGPRDADYTLQAMNQAMLEHRYDVQAALYLLALHRLLKSRLGRRYQPAQHLGGAVYLFLRGVNGPAAGCCPMAAPLALIDAIDALLPSAGYPVHGVPA
ncbi:exodeoxyribonuclease V, beta subunit [Burkholderiales bacterium JOSHI_001]|nr:exodeoxyribonuclease V, beta subunit [Burkholderiales bacterium JOSHI_001]